MSSSSSSAAADKSLDGPLVFGKTDVGAKSVVLRVFREDLGTQLALLAGRGKAKNWRGVLEPIGAVEQCQAVLEASGEEVPCYLCGQRLMKRTDLKMQYSHPLYPECEHILPVTSARWYLTLYMHKRQKTPPKRGASAEEIQIYQYEKKSLDLEYAWAHRICNQTKSNDLFLTEQRDGTVVTNTDAIQATLTAIQKKALEYTTTFATELATTPAVQTILTGIADMDVAAQTSTLATTTVANIVAHINGPTPRDQGLLTLARLSLLTDPTVLDPKLQSAVDSFYKAKGAEIRAAAESRIQELAVQIPDWLGESIPDYSGKDGVNKLLAPLLGASVSKAELVAIAEAMPKLVVDAKQAVYPVLTKVSDRIDVAHPPNVLALVSLYHSRLYTNLWTLLAPLKPSTSTLCALKNILDAVNTNAASGGFGSAIVPVNTSTLVCEGNAAVQLKKEADMLNRMTERQFEAYFTRQEQVYDPTESDPRRLAALALIEFSQGPAPPAVFFEEDTRPYKTATIVLGLTTDLYLLQSELTNTTDKDTRGRLLRKMNAIRTKRLALLTSVLPAIAELVRSKTGGEDTPFYTEFLQTYAPLVGKGRRSRHATSSQRTRRVRHSGLSTKLRKRSYRKSRTETETKRSRC